MAWTRTFVLASLFLHALPFLGAEPPSFAFRGSDVEVSLITIQPGRSLYSAFGHTAIRVVDPSRGTDVLYNYGQSARPFDLMFVIRMLIGRMDFMVGALRSDEGFRFYRDVENRTIIQQRLDLDGAQTESLVAALERDARAEDRLYNYRYFTNNCTTRVWDLLSPFVSQPPRQKSGEIQKTIRGLIDDTLGGRVWLRLAIDLMLGPQSDRPYDDSAPAFLPGQLMRRVAHTSIAGSDGKTSLVYQTDVVYEARRSGLPESGIRPIDSSILVLAFAGLTSFLGLRVKPLARSFDAMLLIFAAVAGVAILMLWLAAGHREVGSNLNLLWAGPAPLAAHLWSRWDPRHVVPIGIFRVFAVLAGIVAVFGGLGIQSIPLELRLIALSVALRCAARGYRLEQLTWS